MPIRIIHVSDIHFGSGESHGRVNPKTGLNVRFEDFVLALSKVVDFALKNEADVFLFSGDAYRNASPEPIYQKMFARQLKRLLDGGVKTILVVGNHDQILRSTSSHALSVFQSLEVPGVMIIDSPVFEVLATKRGRFQLIGLPHVRSNQLMTLEKYAQLPAAHLDRILVEHIHSLLKGYYDELDPDVPTVVTAHMTLDKAAAGIEEELLVGYTQTFPADIFIDPRIDYVALGHVHKHQILRPSAPAIVYAGSLERVDFGEEKEDKGFIDVHLKRHNTKYEFVSIQPRPFVTIEADLTASENPTEDLKKKIRAALLPGCVLRIRYKLGETQLPEVDEDELRKACEGCLSVRFLPEIRTTERRSRLPALNESVVSSPMVALETYLTETAPERKDRLLNKAREMMREIEGDIRGEGMESQPQVGDICS